VMSHKRESLRSGKLQPAMSLQRSEDVRGFSYLRLYYKRSEIWVKALHDGVWQQTHI
jgi:hypothetical protein